MSRIRTVSFTTVLLLILVLLPATRTVHADSSLAGQWNYLVVIQCAQGSGTCATVLGPSPATLFVNGFQASCDAQGQCSYDGYFTIFAGQGTPSHCAADVFGTGTTGICREIETGKVAIMQSDALGQPGFFITDEYASFYGSPPLTAIHQPAGDSSYPLDLLAPAAPGLYDTRQNLIWAGVIKPGDPVPTDISLTLLVTHNGSGPSQALAQPITLGAPGQGVSPALVVSFFSAAPGMGEVYYGSGPGCRGLVQVSTGEVYPGIATHLVIVTGNDLPGTVGNVGITPGATYSYEAVTVSRSGQEVNNNSGTCSTVAVPK